MIEELVLKTIKKYNLINDNDRIVCGVSGGPDSICMLDVLRKIKEEKTINFELIVAHINHLIRDDATLDEQYVQTYCKQNNIKCYVKRIDVNEFAYINKKGTEEAGRIVRYNFFEEVLKIENANKIAIAHNLNDKIETIIMNALRGCGLTGLRGIEPMRDNKYIRPIVEIEREEIEKYCVENTLNPRIDKTNFTNDYTRNKIRNIILPYIQKEFNPNIVNTLNRLSDIIGEEDNFVNELVNDIFERIKILQNKNMIVLNSKEFNNQHHIIKTKLIILAINKTIGNVQNIEKINIEDIIKLSKNNIGNKYLTPNKNIKVSLNKNKLIFESQN